jgi:tetratricopeptide (TPR) repeat protein
VDLYDGMNDELRGLFLAAPETERELLELRLDWPELGEREELVAARLRVFVLTCDPLGWMGDRGWSWATATGDGDSYEVVLYVLLHDALERAREDGGTLAEVIGALGARVVAVGGAHEDLLAAGGWAQLAHTGKVPGLLSDLVAGPGVACELRLAGAGWEPIGLGAIQDLVQDVFGPVDLDRAPVRLEPVARPVAGCPACAGERFGFPAELDERRREMCAEHAERAQEVTGERMERAPASNPDGWNAILTASSSLGEPTFGLPLWLLGRLQDAAERAGLEEPSVERLRADAELVLELAARLAGRPEVFTELDFVDGVSDLWLIDLPVALASRGLVEEAVRVGDALAGLDVDSAAMFASDVAVILAEAGRGLEALGRVEENLRSFPGDFWTQVHAGDVHLALLDLEGAERAFRAALVMARARGDAEEIAAASERLVRVFERQPGREGEAQEAGRELDLAVEAVEEGIRRVVKVGRNDPCPCGSGRKYKRCCGSG